MKSIIKLEKKRLKWSLKTFPIATPKSSLLHLRKEIKEVLHDLKHGAEKELTEEYADCLSLLFDSAGRRGIFPEQIFKAFGKKLKKNKKRNWTKNTDGTYSHI